MLYENKQPPEGINVSKQNPLADFFVLLMGTIALLVAISTFLAFGMGWLAKQIPFEYEESLAQPFEEFIEPSENQSLQIYIDELSQRIQSCSNLSEEIKIKVHYLNEDQFNAFATLGGHVFLFKGLLERVKSENQLAMVLAHEIGHVKHRDPIVGLGRGTVISVAFSLLLGNNPSILGEAGLMTLLSFSRSMESDSDINGVEALNRCYGHANGSYQTFELFKNVRIEMGAKESVLPLFDTHPLDDDRISDIKEFAIENSISLNGELTPLPEDYHSWLNQLENDDVE